MDIEQMVRAFHEKFGCELDKHLALGKHPEADELLYLASGAVRHAHHIVARGKDKGDLRCLRAWLILEELGELLMALKNRDTVQVADGLADLTYVVAGTAATYGIPFRAVFGEVHRSNMTKLVEPPDPNGGLRKIKKGEDFSPANIGSVLASYGKL